MRSELQKVSKSRSIIDAGWSSLVARRAHNPKVVSSNLTPATNSRSIRPESRIPAFFRATAGGQTGGRSVARISGKSRQGAEYEYDVTPVRRDLFIHRSHHTDDD